MNYTAVNGYTNYATWNVCLWVDNEYPLYQEKVAFFDRVCRGEEEASDITINATQAESLFTNLLDGATPDLDDSHGHQWSDVNWEEVAENLTTEAREHFNYDYA